MMVLFHYLVKVFFFTSLSCEGFQSFSNPFCRRQSFYSKRERTSGCLYGLVFDKEDDTLVATTLKNTSGQFFINEEPTNELLNAFTGAAKKAGSDLFVFLRKNAAEALTKSLPDSQRKELLSRVVPEMIYVAKDKNVGEESSRSINEKITAIDLKNTESKIDDQLMKKAEAAVEARILNEIAIQQRLLEDKKRLADEETLRINGELSLQKVFAQNYTNKVHPVLGPCLIDLGYKRIHTVPASTLSTIPVWQKQRIYRHNRAKQMANDKLKTQHFGFPGVILLHEDVTTGKLSILDGQHRVGMMQVLLQRRDKKNTKFTNVDTKIDLEKIVVEVYPQTSSLAQDLFLEVNKAEPVKLIDLPGVGRSKDRQIITDAVEKIADLYPDMFKPSQRCRVPHLNVDNLRDNLFVANVIARNEINTSKQLCDWIQAQNKKLREKYAEFEASVSVSESALEKSRKFDFYLGLESNWIYN